MYLFRTLLLLIWVALLFPMKAQERPPAGGELRRGGADTAALGREVVQFAKQYLGTPYRKAGTDPKKGFDCSGFVGYVFRHFDIRVPRSSKEYKGLSKPLRPEEFRAGDVLVFYGFRDRSHIGHVGIVTEARGMQSKFIHASSGKAMCVVISDLASPGYARRFYQCLRVIP